mgnify:CR=1 FL=1
MKLLKNPKGKIVDWDLFQQGLVPLKLVKASNSRRTHILNPDTFGVNPLTGEADPLAFNERTAQITGFPGYALCGAGKPTRNYPNGTVNKDFAYTLDSIAFRALTNPTLAEGEFIAFSKGGGFPITCYRCLKILAMETGPVFQRDFVATEPKKHRRKHLMLPYGREGVYGSEEIDESPYITVVEGTDWVVGPPEARTQSALADQARIGTPDDPEGLPPQKTSIGGFVDVDALRFAMEEADEDDRTRRNPMKVGDRIQEGDRIGTIAAFHTKGTVDVDFDDMDYTIRRQLRSVKPLRSNPKKYGVWYEVYDPKTAQQSAEVQGIYESLVRRELGLKSTLPFRNENGVRLDETFTRDQVGSLLRSAFQIQTGVAQKHKRLKKKTRKPTKKGKKLSLARQKDRQHLMANIRDYEETLSKARKDPFRVLEMEIDKKKRYYIMPSMTYRNERAKAVAEVKRRNAKAAQKPARTAEQRKQAVALKSTRIRARRNPREAVDIGYRGKNGTMLKNQLRSLARTANALNKALMDGDRVPDWVVTKAAVALDNIQVAEAYVVSKLEGMKVNPYRRPKEATAMANAVLIDLKKNAKKKRTPAGRVGDVDLTLPSRLGGFRPRERPFKAYPVEQTITLPDGEVIGRYFTVYLEGLKQDFPDYFQDERRGGKIIKRFSAPTGMRETDFSAGVRYREDRIKGGEIEYKNMVDKILATRYGELNPLSSPLYPLLASVINARATGYAQPLSPNTGLPLYRTKKVLLSDLFEQLIREQFLRYLVEKSEGGRGDAPDVEMGGKYRKWSFITSSYADPKLSRSESNEWLNAWKLQQLKMTDADIIEGAAPTLTEVLYPRDVSEYLVMLGEMAYPPKGFALVKFEATEKMPVVFRFNEAYRQDWKAFADMLEANLGLTLKITNGTIKVPNILIHLSPPKGTMSRVMTEGTERGVPTKVPASVIDKTTRLKIPAFRPDLRGKVPKQDDWVYAVQPTSIPDKDLNEAVAHAITLRAMREEKTVDEVWESLSSTNKLAPIELASITLYEFAPIAQLLLERHRDSGRIPDLSELNRNPVTSRVLKTVVAPLQDGGLDFPIYGEEIYGKAKK